MQWSPSEGRRRPISLTTLLLPDLLPPPLPYPNYQPTFILNMSHHFLSFTVSATPVLPTLGLPVRNSHLNALVGPLPHINHAMSIQVSLSMPRAEFNHVEWTVVVTPLPQIQEVEASSSTATLDNHSAQAIIHHQPTVAVVPRSA